MRPAVTCAIVFLCHFTSASNSSSTLVLGCAPTHRRRFDHRDDVLMVYLRRIRKAGSTTIFRGLQHFFNTSGRLQADEQNPINGRCVVTEVSHLKTGWNGSLPLVPSPSVLSRILFVTHLREPLARQKSEFYYVGPGSKRAAQKRGGPARNTDAEWFTWISEGTRAHEQGNHSCVIHGSQYLDNVMVRALGADCGSCRFAKAPPHLRGCQLCGRHGRPPQLERVGTLQLQRATNVLEAFDLVIRPRTSWGRRAPTHHIPRATPTARVYVWSRKDGSRSA